MFNTASVLARGKAAIVGNETEQRIAVLLYDDTVQVISSFELNQIASLTYHESQVITSDTDMTDIILNHLQQIMSQPINYSPISIHKSLVVTKYCLIFGASKVVPAITQQLGRHIESLREYNTILLAQQQAGAWLMRLKGGGVDKGGPVRELATKIFTLLQNPQQLQSERNRLADPNSLVPIGEKKQVAFATDEVKLRYLKQEMEKQRQVQIKSNLVKSTDGFGAGYMSKDGKAVVGAAHGIEEMLKQQRLHEQKFRDEQQKINKQAYSEYQAPDLFASNNENNNYQTNNNNNIIGSDLLGTATTSMPQQQQQSAEVDLLDFGATDSNSAAVAPSSFAQEDLLSLGGGMANTNPSSATYHDPFQMMTAPATTTTTTTTATTDTADLMANLSLLSPTTGTVAVITTPSSTTTSTVETKKSVMGSNVDRFAALDALVENKSTTASTPPAHGNPLSGLGGMTAPTSNTTSSNAFAGLTDLSGLGSNKNSSSGMASSIGIGSSSAMGANISQQLSFGTNQSGDSSDAVPAFAMPPTSSIQVSQPMYGGNQNDDDDGFVMGGTTGSGLTPLGPAPAAPPPPPGAF